MAAEANAVVVPTRAEVTGTPFDPRIEVFSGETSLGLVKVETEVQGDTITYRTPDGAALGTLTLDQHIACPTCGHSLPGEAVRITEDEPK